MILSSRICAALFALLVGAAGAAEPTPDPASVALHLLDYIGVDYGGAVADGRIKDADEYKEMMEFSAQARDLVRSLPENPARAALEADAAKLVAQVERRDDAAAVAASARKLREAIVIAYAIRTAPPRAADPDRGNALFAEHCAGCHGAAGAGDGPLARGLDPVPTNFHDRARMSGRPLHSFYNTITLGVKGTAMRSFATLSEEDRWDLAAKVASFTATDSPLDFAAQRIAASARAYQAGDRAAASTIAIQAYLEGFELAEKALAHVDAPLMTRIERAMMDYRRLVQSGAPSQEVAARAQEIERLLGDARQALQGGAMSAAATFTAALVILLREGLEAVLVLAAILGFLAKAGRNDARRYVHAGWIGALIVGAATWYFSSRVIAISGASREVTEGVTALISAAMLLYVGFWLHNKSNTASWQRFVRTQVGGAVDGGTVGALATISFLAVYREVFETVLFYQALAAQAGPEGHAGLVGGVAVGFAALVVMSWLILRWSARVPLTLFFKASAALMAALAVVFTGQGIAALQEAGWVDIDLLGSASVPMLGIFPTRQTLGAQALVAMAIALGFWWARRTSASDPSV